MLEVAVLLKEVGLAPGQRADRLDIVPLFETIDDLAHCPDAHGDAERPGLPATSSGREATARR